MRVLLLGERAVVPGDGDPVTSLRAVSLIAYLAAHAGVPQARAAVAAALWPDTATAQGLTNLRRELHHLRRHLAENACLEVSSTHLTWHDDPACPVDLIELRRAGRALRAAADGRTVASEESVAGDGLELLTLYRGELLPGVDEAWAAGLREQVEREFVDACDALVAVGAVSSPSSPLQMPALDAARRRVRLRPLEERGHVALVDLLRRRGDLPGALEAYHWCVRVLRDELGVDPAPATRGLLEELLAHDAGRGGRRSAGVRPDRLAPRARSPRSARAVGRQEADPLVGRRRELAVLRSELDAAGAGGLRVAVVHGEAGSGKSRLVEELIGHAHDRGLRTAVGRGHAMAGAVALAPVLDWLGGDGLGVGEDADAREHARAWSRLVFVRDLARQVATTPPGMLVLEDLQWVDQDTLDLVSALARWERDAPLLLVVTARSGVLEERTDLSRWATGLREQVPVRTVRTGPLPLDEGAVLLRRHGDPGWDDGRCLDLHAATGGFPLHLVEAARLVARHERVGARPAMHLPAGGLRGVLASRLTSLSDAAQQLAGVAAAVGRSAPLALLHLAGGLEDTATVQALDELCRAAVLAERDGGYDFVHDLVRDTAYGLQPPALRALVHLRVGEALEELHATHLEDVSAMLGEHFSRAGRPERAVGHLRAAARGAQKVFATERCIELLRAAVGQLRTLPPGPARDAEELECLHDLAAVLNARHGWTAPALRVTLERAHELAAGLHDDTALADVLTSLWGTDYVGGANASALAVALAAQTAAARTADAARAAVGRFAVGATLLQMGRPREGLSELQGAMAVDMSAIRLAIGSRPEVHARAWAAHAHALLGSPGAAQEFSDQALERAGSHPYDRALALAYAAVTAHLLDDREALEPLVDELRHQCARYDLGYYGSWGQALSGWLTGGPDGAGMVRRAIGDLRATGAGARSSYFLCLLASTLDDPPQARAVLDAAAATARAQQDLWWLPEIERRRALLRPEGMRQAGLEAALAQALEQESPLLVESCRRSLAALPGD
ncbi:ATP-binding protein [Ornithinimicrobium sp. LYQ103]|uniref:ATP-binding protein n=1 Tax=Ornithinimicrobium sp. LYQ103 TaxID=3378796 RepID=UPI003852ADCF